MFAQGDSLSLKGHLLALGTAEFLPCILKPLVSSSPLDELIAANLALMSQEKGLSGILGDLRKDLTEIAKFQRDTMFLQFELSSSNTLPEHSDHL